MFVKEDCLVHESKYGCITCKLFVYQSGHVANCGNKLIFYAMFCFRKEHFKHSVSKLPVCHWMVVVFNSDIVFRLLYRLYFNVLHQSLHGLFLDGVSLPHVKKQNKTKQKKRETNNCRRYECRRSVNYRKVYFWICGVITNICSRSESTQGLWKACHNSKSLAFRASLSPDWSCAKLTK